MAKVKKRVKKTAPKKGPVILPRKMSALIRIALRDIRKVEKDYKKYVVDMGVYFNPNTSVTCTTDDGDVLDNYKVCSLCAAGAVMAFSLGKANSGKQLVPESFPRNMKQLRAIDSLRSGSVQSAANLLGIDKVVTSLEEDIPDYERDDPEPFHAAMEKLQEKLVKAGL